MIDIRQDLAWGKYLEKRGGWKAEWVKRADGKGKMLVSVMNYRWFPLGFLKLQRNEHDPDFSDLKRLKKKYRVFYSIIEPLKIQKIERYQKAGYRKTNKPYLATKTYVIDLSKSEKVLWNNLSENARRMIKKNGALEIREVSREEFYSLWKKYSKTIILSRREFEALVDSFGKKAHLWAGVLDGKIQSTLLWLETDDLVNYYQTITTDEGRKSGAHYGLVWKVIMEGKKRGRKWLDFEGIFDKRWKIGGWQGFSEFKRRFGGNETSFLGSFGRWF